MAYTKQIWKDNESIANAERLNHIEDGIYEASLVNIVDNINATGDNDVPNAKAVKDAILGEVLWENPNPNQNFGAQDITLKNDDYSILEFVYKLSPTTEIYATSRIPKGVNGVLSFSQVAGVGPQVDIRNVNRKDDKTYTIATAKQAIGSTVNYSLSNRLIPTKVIGYK